MHACSKTWNYPKPVLKGSNSCIHLLEMVHGTDALRCTTFVFVYLSQTSKLMDIILILIYYIHLYTLGSQVSQVARHLFVYDLYMFVIIVLIGVRSTSTRFKSDLFTRHTMPTSSQTQMVGSTATLRLRPFWMTGWSKTTLTQDMEKMWPWEKDITKRLTSFQARRLYLCCLCL